MVVLAIETASRGGSMACADAAGLHARHGDADRPHGDRLPLEVTTWLASLGHALGDVDRFAVVTGPGSFTGLRVGLATVQGWALALDRPVVPVSTFDAVGESWRRSAAYRPEAALGVFLEGLRTEIFGAVWLPARGQRPAGFSEPAAGTVESIAAHVRAEAGTGPLVLAGGAVERHRVSLVAALAPVHVHDVAEPLAGGAASLARGAAAVLVGPDAIRVLYVRRPDAKSPDERHTPHASLPAFVVRTASGPDDLAAVDALQRRTFTNPWGADAMKWELDHTDVARLYLIAEAGGRVIGYCACWLVFDELHVNSLAIDEAFRRRGAASALLRQVFDEAVSAGARSATLEVRASNAAALGLYGHLGFRVEGTRRDYYQHPREDALILWNRHLESGHLPAA